MKLLANSVSDMD
jgi:hypothetical protein